MGFVPDREPGRTADRVDDGTSVATLGIPAHVPTRTPATDDGSDRPVPAHVDPADDD
jgi:hypothetical protein